MSFAEWLAGEPGFALLVAVIAFLVGLGIGERNRTDNEQPRRR
jgi:hypothetical protein